MNKIILASASPRRKELLAQIRREFEVSALNLPEKSAYLRPHRLVCDLACQKAGDLPARYPDDIVVSADTIVWFEGEVYGKPRDEKEAEEYLTRMSGEWHTVYTGVCVTQGVRRIVFYDKSRVKFRKLSQEQIRAYIRDKRPLDKAGAYGIQDNEVVERYRGSYSNIMGLPVERLDEVLKRMESADEER